MCLASYASVISMLGVCFIVLVLGGVSLKQPVLFGLVFVFQDRVYLCIPDFADQADLEMVGNLCFPSRMLRS